MTVLEWQEKYKDFDWKEIFGANIKGARSRPLVLVKCIKCLKDYTSRRLRGRWTGLIQILDTSTQPTQHNIIEAPYICVDCKNQS